MRHAQGCDVVRSVETFALARLLLPAGANAPMTAPNRTTTP
jgi:hypothetical protein